MLNYELARCVTLRNWNALVQETYGRPYSLQQQDGCRGRGIVRLDVSEDALAPDPEYDDPDHDLDPEDPNDMCVGFATWLRRDPKPTTPDQNTKDAIWWLRNFYPSLESVAYDLFKRGLIEAGQYIIIIDW